MIGWKNDQQHKIMFDINILQQHKRIVDATLCAWWNYADDWLKNLDSLKSMFDINIQHQHKRSVDTAPDETTSMIGWKNDRLDKINVWHRHASSTEAHCGRIFMQLMKQFPWYAEKMSSSMKSMFVINTLHDDNEKGIYKAPYTDPEKSRP